MYSPNLSGIGHNELIVGKALKGFREEVVLATKLMLHGFGFGSVYKSIRSHLEGSLERLQTDYVDMFSDLERSLKGLKVYGHRGLGGF